MLSAIKKIIPGKIKETMKKVVYDLVEPPVESHGYTSYAQAGEDRVLDYLFASMGITQPSYLDIGTNLPIAFNNTYLFYKRGGSGVCVEPDPAIFDELSRVRSRDKCLNIGITHDERREADFYVFDIPSLNTLSPEEADLRETAGSHKVKKIIKIPLKTINEVLDENFDLTPDLISIDVEGVDLEVLRSLDFERHRPLAICAETITYSENRTERKMTEITDFVTSMGYLVYADTHINTIFVDEARFSDQSEGTNTARTR